MNWESWLEPKNSRNAATTGRMLINVIGEKLVLVADGHALLDDAFHAPQADAQLVLNQLAHRLGAAVAQVIDIIWVLYPIINQNHAPNQANDIPFSDRPVGNAHSIV